jgi:hypothetical protein
MALDRLGNSSGGENRGARRTRWRRRGKCTNAAASFGRARCHRTCRGAVTPSPQFATLTEPVKIKISYGETVLPRGLKLPVLRRDGQTVTVQYLGQTQVVPIASTDLR